MKRLLAALLGALAVAAARADEGGPGNAGSAGALPIARHGYAVDQPDVLIRQRVFGLAHGVSLLAGACLDLPEHSLPIQDAYAAWRIRQVAVIDQVARELAAHHFGERHGEANWQDLARALRLKDDIAPSLRGVTLAAACASLPEALARPRYDFAALLAEAGAAETPPAAPPTAPPAAPEAAPAVPPGLTFEKAAAE